MTSLQRRLGRIDALAISLGGVIGVGVFRSTGVVLRGAGGVGGATLIWIVCGIVCLSGALLYADLSGRVPEAGGPYAYVRVAFGRPTAFVFGWMNAAVAIPARQAAGMAVIGDVLGAWLPVTPRVLAIGVVLLLFGLNLLGVRAGALAQRVFTSAKLATILLVIALAMALASAGGHAASAAAALPPVSFAVAVSGAWYAYLGWQDTVLLAEELHHPRRDLPVVLVGTVVTVLVLYTGIHLAVYFGLHGDAVAYGKLPALDVAERALGGVGTGLLSALMLSSMFGGQAEGMMVRPRMAMALARDGLAPAPMAQVSKVGTPYGALVFHVAIVLALVATGSFTELLPLLAFAQGVLGILETASYFVVRKARPELPTMRFHPWAPLAFIVTNVALCVITAWADPLRAGLAVALIALVGVVYAVVVRR